MFQIYYNHISKYLDKDIMPVSGYSKDCENVTLIVSLILNKKNIKE